MTGVGQSMGHRDTLNYIAISLYPNLSIFDIAKAKHAISSQQT